VRTHASELPKRPFVNLFSTSSPSTHRRSRYLVAQPSTSSGRWSSRRSTTSGSRLISCLGRW
jgi:hypothetical protein